MNNRGVIQPLYAVFISLFALIVATIALFIAKETKQLALSEITVEDRNSLVTPVFDQELGQWSYLAIWELSVTNQSGPPISLKSIEKVKEGSGFLVPLLKQEIVSKNIPYKSFLCDHSITEIRSNPKILKEVASKDMGEEAKVNLPISPGESKTIRLGITLKPYGDNNRPLASVILVSYKLQFSNGKSYVFRRGFPIQPIKQ